MRRPADQRNSADLPAERPSRSRSATRFPPLVSSSIPTVVREQHPPMSQPTPTPRPDPNRGASRIPGMGPARSPRYQVYGRSSNLGLRAGGDAPRLHRRLRTCSNCGSSNPADARFCFHCGLPLADTCPNCGADLVPVVVAARGAGEHDVESTEPTGRPAASLLPSWAPAAPPRSSRARAESERGTVRSW